ncbi:MAG: cell division protein FtsL [Bacilli bacterium]|nr:cell division protein FtsL [Bacilli bacterium]
MRTKKNKSEKMKPLDRLMLIVIFILSIAVPTSVVFSQATLSKSNIEVEKMKNKVEKQQNSNQSLSMQLDELASLSNIQDIAKAYGLSYNNDNIIVINN